ncbi:MAG: nucleotide exchange factor GrpE, partial [Deltaproteobacteria bacterium]|nr:nucleotide exchange factor GrpE [Deltaproteobacteria bacterium]
GVDLVRKGLMIQLEKFGLREVDVLGKTFDPSEHEALTMVDNQSQKAGAILEIHRRGYWLGDRLLRPALVTVAKGPQETT